MRTAAYLIAILMLTNLLVPARAQEVSIPDPGLEAAIRVELQLPFGPLTTQDLLTLTNLNASSRNISSIEGLEAARNLMTLNLQVNRLTSFSLPSDLTRLISLNVSANPLTNVLLPNGLTNLTTLILEGDGLAALALPGDLPNLRTLDVDDNELTTLTLPPNLTSLVSLDLSFNLLTNFTFPDAMTNLTTFIFAGNLLTNFSLPPGLSSLTDLYLAENQLTSFTLPADMTNLLELTLSFNQLTNVAFPDALPSLLNLDLDFNRLTSLELPSNLTNLLALHLRDNLFTNFSLPAGLTGLTYLDISEGPLSSITFPGDLYHLSTLRLSRNRLTTFTLPAGLTNLTMVLLSENQLTNVVLASDLNRLETLNVSANQLTSLTLPTGLTNLSGLFFVNNLLTNVTLPPDATQLTALGFLANPLTTFVLPEPLATGGLAEDVAALRSQGVSVFSYPLTVQLIRLRQPPGAFQFAVTGPPAVYTVLGSPDLTAWSALGAVTNSLGAIVFTDTEAHLSPRKFYRAQRQTPPANMVFIPPNTFMMGSPTNEQDRSIFEGPQATVTLTHGFWIGKYEVTQEEYLSVMGTNPSDFPGDLRRPVSSVSWFDATNYCARLTQRELAAGCIPAGSQYRLPTEAEWECAARAGTTTRFNYGDDPTYGSLTNFAWFLDLAVLDLTVHPVGQKLPNPWGLYDMYGNVWEWCQDWYGDQLGGVQTDPAGPASNPNGNKVMRGGAYDYPNSSCRSASRLFASQFHTDTDLGFRVVLVPALQ